MDNIMHTKYIFPHVCQRRSWQLAVQFCVYGLKLEVLLPEDSSNAHQEEGSEAKHSLVYSSSEQMILPRWLLQRTARYIEYVYKSCIEGKDMTALKVLMNSTSSLLLLLSLPLFHVSCISTPSFFPVLPSLSLSAGLCILHTAAVTLRYVWGWGAREVRLYHTCPKDFSSLPLFFKNMGLEKSGSVSKKDKVVRVFLRSLNMKSEAMSKGWIWMSYIEMVIPFWWSLEIRVRVCCAVHT